MGKKEKVMKYCKKKNNDEYVHDFGLFKFFFTSMTWTEKKRKMKRNEKQNIGKNEKLNYVNMHVDFFFFF